MSRPPDGGFGTSSEETAPSGKQALSPLANDEDGVDRTLIREFLRLSPTERLDVVDGYAQEIEELRKGVRQTPVGP